MITSNMFQRIIRRLLKEFHDIKKNKKERDVKGYDLQNESQMTSFFSGHELPNSRVRTLKKDYIDCHQQTQICCIYMSTYVNEQLEEYIDETKRLEIAPWIYYKNRSQFIRE